MWHLLEARRDDGQPAMFRIRDLAPQPAHDRIFVVELPYRTTSMSRLPDAAGYRRLHAFQDQWVVPACTALGWVFVATKIDDGSFFVYVYGSGDPNPMIGRLAPFDPALGFFDEPDPAWAEYAVLRELLAQGQALPAPATAAAPARRPATRAARSRTQPLARAAKPANRATGTPTAKTTANPAANRTAKATAKPAARRTAKATAKRTTKTTAAAAAKRTTKATAKPAAKAPARRAARPARRAR